MANQKLSALAAYPGKYAKALFAKFFQSLDFRNDITTVPDVKSTINLTKLKINDGPRPFTGTYAVLDEDLEYVPNQLTVERFQRDFKVIPAEYSGTFLEEFTGPGSNSKNKNIPFAQFTWEAVMQAQAEDLNNRTAYFGVGKAAYSAFNAGTVYTAGNRMYITASNRVDYYKCLATTTAGQTPTTHPAKWKRENAEAITKGLGTKIADAITATSIIPVTTGALTDTTAYAQFLAVWRNLPEVIKIKGAKLYCSVNAFEKLEDDFENRVSKYTVTDDAGRIFLSKTNKKCQLMPVSWMSGSSRLIATPKENLMTGFDQIGDENVIDTMDVFYQVQATMSAVLGFGIRDFDYISVNEQV